MKPYIAAYKAGASEPSVDQDQLVYWYRPTPKDVQCTGDPLGPPNGRDLLTDAIFVTTLLTSPGQLTVQSGSNSPITIDVPAGVTTHNFTMGVGSQSFSFSRSGSTIMGGAGGLDITETCVYYNYNAYVGSFNGTGSGTSPPSPTTTTKMPTSSTTKTSIQSTTTTELTATTTTEQTTTTAPISSRSTTATTSTTTTTSSSMCLL